MHPIAGDKVNFKAIHTNTGASTIAVNGLATKALTKYGTVALSGGEIVANHVYGATYDGTQFQLGEASDSLSAQSAQLKSQFLATDTGTSNAYAVALSPVPLALTTGLTVVFTPANANTGSSTLTVGALTAKNLTKYGAVALTGGELVPGVYYEAQYDGTQFQILSEIPNVGASPFWAGTSGGTANAQTLTPTPAIPAYYAGQTFVFKASASNTGATTLNVSGLAHQRRGARGLRRNAIPIAFPCCYIVSNGIDTFWIPRRTANLTRRGIRVTCGPFRCG